MKTNELSEIAARKTVQRLLKYRPRSRHEILTKLTHKGFSQSIITQTIQYFEEIKQIDDPLLLKGLIQSLLNKPIGPLLILPKLLQMGFSKREILNVMNNLKLPEQQAQIIQFFETRGYTPKTASFLTRNGFDPEIIQTVLHYAHHEIPNHDL